MKYIVREVGKTGGTEFDNPDDAIHAAAEWDFDTRRPCEIYLIWRFLHPCFGLDRIRNGRIWDAVELLSIPHTLEARAMTAAWRVADLSELERCFDALS